MNSKISIVFVLVLFTGAVTSEKKTLAEHEILPAMLSTILGTSSRLELEKHRPTKTLASLIMVGRGENDTLRALPTSSDSNQQINPTVISKAKQDAIIRQLWGGECSLDDWVNCNNITTFGGDYFVKDKIEHFEMECTTFKWVCMVNGWTVNRCHLLCMSACNRDLLETNKYDRWVLHEGMCEPISKKGK
ncbi:unnamed protein product [Allacma fusca]|uniref:Secreted protein n=1 Tax=Allacma fusca TaxID=39272 RepID=A0A8J2KKD4_9HEXA|nr:unnamed protein product [Allacma fusca]